MTLSVTPPVLAETPGRRDAAGPGGARTGGQVERRLPGRRFRPNPSSSSGPGDPPRPGPASSGRVVT